MNWTLLIINITASAGAYLYGYRHGRDDQTNGTAIRINTHKHDRWN